MIKNYFCVSNRRFHIADKHIFILQGYFKQNSPNTSQVKVYLDKEELQTQIHEYSGIEIKRKYMSSNQSVDTEYHVYVTLPSDYGIYKKMNIYTVTGDEKYLSLNIPVSNIEKMASELEYCIDGVEKTGQNYIIRGWAIAGRQVDFTVETSGGKREDIQVKRTNRMDVTSNYKEKELEGDCGFEIEVENPSSHKLVVIMHEDHKVTKQKLVVGKSPKGIRSNYPAMAGKGIRYLKNFGMIKTIKKTIAKLQQKPFSEVDYTKWRRQHVPSQTELKEQSEINFHYQPCFSIVVPLYKTPEHYLESFVESVRQQTYKNWELCLSDGSGADSPLKDILSRLESENGRVKVIRNHRRLRISENTNEAIKTATGDFIVFADHDDLLSPDALYECAKALNRDQSIELLYSDEDKISMDGKAYFQPHFKSDFNIDLLCSMNYISHLFVAKKEIVDRVGLLDPRFDGAQDYDFILRCIDATKNIYHIPKVLYHWRAHQASTAENPESKLYAFEAGERAVQAHYDRLGIPAEVVQGEYLGLYRTRYKMIGNPMISIIIPNKDHIEDLDLCIQSIENKSSYDNYEYIIVENNSTDEATFSYYKQLQEDNPKVRVVYYEGDFNYSLINNFGVTYAEGAYVLLLNNDTEIINEDCLEEMLGCCMRDDVGIVGARLFYEDNTIQHAGTVVGFGGIAGHAFIGKDRSENGYFSRIICMQDYSAVTAACMMVKKSVFEAVGGLSPELKVAFNDVDFCLKVREYGKLVVYNPYAMLYHYESKSRGLEDTPEKVTRFNKEIDTFSEKWSSILKNGDPYYNPNLTLDKSDFSLR